MTTVLGIKHKVLAVYISLYLSVRKFNHSFCSFVFVNLYLVVPSELFQRVTDLLETEDFIVYMLWESRGCHSAILDYNSVMTIRTIQGACLP